MPTDDNTKKKAQLLNLLIALRDDAGVNKDTGNPGIFIAKYNNYREIAKQLFQNDVFLRTTILQLDPKKHSWSSLLANIGQLIAYIENDMSNVVQERDKLKFQVQKLKKENQELKAKLKGYTKIT
jgi:seryl-tRNA synthetase